MNPRVASPNIIKVLDLLNPLQETRGATEERRVVHEERDSREVRKEWSVAATSSSYTATVCFQIMHYLLKQNIAKQEKNYNAA